jgi:hypothetical protein
MISDVRDLGDASMLKPRRRSPASTAEFALLIGAIAIVLVLVVASVAEYLRWADHEQCIAGKPTTAATSCAQPGHA